MATASAPQTSQGARPSFILPPVLRGTAIAGTAWALLPGSHRSRRAAMAAASAAFQSPSGSLAMVAVKACSAASFDRSANRAASSHGSTPSRVNAVRTVSDMPIFSSPTEANRKSLYSEWPREYSRRRVMILQQMNRRQRRGSRLALARRHLRQEVVLFIGRTSDTSAKSAAQAANHERVEPPGKRSGIGRHLAVENGGLVGPQGRDVGNVGVALLAKRGGQRLDEIVAHVELEDGLGAAAVTLARHQPFPLAGAPVRA